MIDTSVDTRRGIIPEDLLKLELVEDIALDPTGRWVAYSVKRADAATNGYSVQVYVQPVEGGAARRLTLGQGRAASLAWSRDGQQLAFV